MSEFERQALNTNFENWKNARLPDEPDESKAFERYAIELILKDLDLSDEEIVFGHIGGGGDGGADGFYFMVNRVLVMDETEVPATACESDLIIIQVTGKSTFQEPPLLRFKEVAELCFNWDLDLDQQINLRQEVIDAIKLFRDTCPTESKLNVKFHYVAKSTLPPDHNLAPKVKNIQDTIKSHATRANVEIKFWTCQDLMNAALAQKKEEHTLIAIDKFSTDDDCAVCLVKLEDFAKFITENSDGVDRLRMSMFEPNVRDYQGADNDINTEIRQTLSRSNSGEEFWWLNNGVTIIAETCSIMGRKITVTKPEIVNGLQTSFEIFGAFQGQPNKSDGRNLLVRVIVTGDREKQNRIIKATNSQTPVSPISLHATDRIHFAIEDRLLHYDLYYDRRKGEQRRLKKPISKIVSIKSLGQSVISIFLQRPSDARGRPTMMLKDKDTYVQVFPKERNTQFYAACILLDRRIGRFVVSSKVDRTVRAHLHYHVMMVAACYALKLRRPDEQSISAATDIFKNASDDMLGNCLAIVKPHYDKQPGKARERFSKSPEFEQAVGAVLDNTRGAFTDQQQH